MFIIEVKYRCRFLYAHNRSNISVEKITTVASSVHHRTASHVDFELLFCVTDGVFSRI